MKKSLPPFLAGVLTTVLLGSIALPAFANVITARTAIEVDPINILVNGETFVPHDVNGNEVAVFAYNGTTYAPLRALAEAYGLEVWYNQEKNMATVGEVKGEQTKIIQTSDEEYETFKAMWKVVDRPYGTSRYLTATYCGEMNEAELVNDWKNNKQKYEKLAARVNPIFCVKSK